MLSKWDEGRIRAGGGAEAELGWLGVARRAVVWSAVVVAVLALCSWAGAATKASPQLSHIATEFRGGGVHETVYCSDTQADWSATLSRRHLPHYAVGFAYIGQPKVWLSPSICAGIARVDPWAILVFVHELIHTTGIRNERTTNCRALAAERSFLQRFFGLSPDQAQSVYEQSNARALNEPPQYRPTSC